MPTIKTMKGQADEAGNTITNWPADGVVNCVIPMDAPSGKALGTPAANITQTDLISGGTWTPAFFVNVVGGKNTVVAGAAATLAGVKPIGNASAVFMCILDIGANKPVFDLGDGGNLITTSSVGNGTQKIVDSSGTAQTGVGNQFNFTGGAVDQLVVIILDRPNKLVSFYEGQNGDVLLGTLALSSSAATFDWEGKIPLSFVPVNTDGLCVFRFENLPTLVKIQEMCKAVATELRKGVDTLHPDPVRAKWVYNIIADHIL